MAGKKITKARAKVEDKLYALADGIDLLRSVETSKFDESVEIHMRLGIDPTKTDQAIRGAVVLPHGLGKTVRVAVIAGGEKLKEAQASGADHVGAEDLIDKIAGGWMEFDTLIATPDMMGKVAKVGKILGPKGLMPNPKTGTVTFDIAGAVRETKAGKVEYRLDKGANIHAAVGKKSFDRSKIEENARSFIDAIVRAKPASAKGVYVKRVVLTSTMGPGIHLDPAQFTN